MSSKTEIDTRTPTLMRSGIVLPTDQTQAAAALMKLSQNGSVPPFWHANPRHGLHLTDRRPAGTRPYPHVALVKVDKEHLAVGRVDVRYHDGYTVTLLLTELAAGGICLPGEIAERWMIAESGERDMAGRTHE